jgi:von Willebrand factor type A domain
MRRRLVSAVALLFLAGSLDAQELGPVDWIFLVDTSKSMRGIGGTKDIFDEVKASIDSFIREANDGDTVAIFTFDRDAHLRSAMTINAGAREDLYQIVHSLEADGNRTHLGAAIAKGLERAAALRAKSDPTRSRAVVLFTDGREDTRGIENPVSINANLPQIGEAFVFFVSMGEHEPQLDAFTAQTERASVLKAPTAEAIRRVAQEIRARIPKPPPPPAQQPEPIEAQPPPPPSPLLQALKVAAIVAVAALIAFIVIQQRRKKNRLEGELEVLRPGSAGDDAFIGLPRLQASEVALSSILPHDALAGSDARLFVKRKDGKKKVWIRAEGGPLRINDVETPLGELYDADTIEIGGAKLRFNRVGDERPLESQEGAL